MYRIGTIVVLISIYSFATNAKAQLMGVDETHTEITSPPSSEQPMFLEVGEELMLKCTDTDGDDVQWYKDTETIDTTADKGFVMTTKKEKDPKNNGRLTTNSFLVKSKAELSDSSTYECRPAMGKTSYRMIVEVFEIRAEPAHYTKGKPVTLQCTVEGLTSYKPLVWYRKGERIAPTSNKYRTDDLNDTLTILNADNTDAGVYECGFTLSNGKNYTKQVDVSSVPSVSQFEKSKNLVQGDPLVLNCEVSGWPTPTVSWHKEGQPVDSSDSRVSFSPYKNVVNGTLRIDKMDFADRAEYGCTAFNSMGISNSTILVRVKDKLAALWPFLGICAEVTILCLIIFIYEKRRAKKMEEEDAPEEAGHLTNSHDHKGKDDIRHRK